jgi:two-component system chemotaxis response regulator CheY
MSEPSPPSVLIVDDDPFIRRLIVATLQDVTGFVLHQAGDGHEALAEAERCPPALVFLDMQMPGLDGLATCRALREREETRDATIVMLTAAGGHAEAASREAGADHFLTKPFSPLDLLRLVDELGAAAEPRPSARRGRT